MQQLELFDYRRDYLFDSKNQIAHWYDILTETKETISYAEHIDPNKGYTTDNIQLLTHKANTWKSSFSNE